MNQERRPQRRRRSSIEDYSREMKEKRQAIEDQAAEKNLKQFSYNVWTEQDWEPGTIPSKFYVAQYLDQPQLREFRGPEFPISNLDDLLKTVEALDNLYEATENPVVYERHGVVGFIDFIKERFITPKQGM